MSHAIYMAFSGLRSRERALEVVSNNLANVQAGGFKKQLVSFSSRLARPDEYTHLAGTINRPAVAAQSWTDFSVGNLVETGNRLQLALMGEGFFVVETRQGLRYTRNGDFAVNEKGELVTQDGLRVMAETGRSDRFQAITLPPGEVQIAPSGQVSVDGVVAGQVRVVSFNDVSLLSPAGGTLFEPQETARETVPARTEVIQGYLEQSNVNPVSSMTEVISLMRGYEMLTRTIRTLTNEVDRKVINEVGRV
jgi:flagellar basal-body rod protein FlgG